MLTRQHEIILNWGLHEFASEARRQAAIKRAAICGACALATFKGFNYQQIDGRSMPISWYKCGGCNCPGSLANRTRSTSKDCPKQKWAND